MNTVITPPPRVLSPEAKSRAIWRAENPRSVNPHRPNAAYLTVVARIISRNLFRLLVIVGLTAISTALVTGIGTLAPRMRSAIDAQIEAGVNPMFLALVSGTADGIERIAAVFPTLFTLVVALVVFMTITRLVESERSQIGCLASLGYTRHQIVSSYMPFTAIGCIVGGAIGLLLGHFFVGPVIYAIIKDNFGLPDGDPTVPWVGIGTALALIALMLLITLIAANATARAKPTLLFVRKPPPAGRKLFLERFPGLWSRISYRHKSTIRNIVRYRIRFVLTVFSMLLSTVIVYAGLALRSALSESNPELDDTMGPISLLLVVAAIFINTLVVYNITNINIEERIREIATLKVLGYRPAEVAGYVFREIAWLAFMGIALGLPAGWFLMVFIFDFLEFGGIEFISFWVWPATLALSLAALLLADALLYRRLVGVDMNTSLKTIE